MGNRIIVRARKKAAEKRMIRIRRRMHVLSRLDRHENEERVPLEEPKFWGYQRCLILRKDIANRSDAPRLLELLKTVQKVEECRRKDFKVWDRDSKRWLEWNHTPRWLLEPEFLRLPERLRCFFEPGWDRYRRRIYLISEPWMFESRRQKLWITHRFIPNTEVKRESAYWSDIWDQNCLYWHFNKVKSRRRNAWKQFDFDPRERLVKRVHVKEINEATEVHRAGLLAYERGKEVMHDAQT